MGELIMGKGSYGDIIRRGVGNTITVGNYCSIAEGCVFDGGFGHNTKFVTTYPLNAKIRGCYHLTGHPVCKGDIVIGNDVWLGEGCMIMSGITIGDGAVVGARSIVTKNLLPYTMSVGSPAKTYKKRFTDEQIEKLLCIKWWDWDDKKIIHNAHLLMSEDIDLFISAHS